VTKDHKALAPISAASRRVPRARGGKAAGWCARSSDSWCRGATDLMNDFDERRVYPPLGQERRWWLAEAAVRAQRCSIVRRGHRRYGRGSALAAALAQGRDPRNLAGRRGSANPFQRGDRWLAIGRARALGPGNLKGFEWGVAADAERAPVRRTARRRFLHDGPLDLRTKRQLGSDCRQLAEGARPRAQKPAGPLYVSRINRPNRPPLQARSIDLYQLQILRTLAPVRVVTGDSRPHTLSCRKHPALSRRPERGSPICYDRSGAGGSTRFSKFRILRGAFFAWVNSAWGACMNPLSKPARASAQGVRQSILARLVPAFCLTPARATMAAVA